MRRRKQTIFYHRITPFNQDSLFLFREMNLTIDKPRITTITTIEIVISKQSEQESKLQEIKEKILNSEKGSKIRLILKTIAEDDAAMLKLQT